MRKALHETSFFLLDGEGGPLAGVSKYLGFLIRCVDERAA